MDPLNPLEFLMAFLPGKKRRLTRTGVQIHCLQYWSDALEPWIGQGKRLWVHYDPRDITFVYVRLPSGVSIKASVTTPGIAAISLAEWQARRQYEGGLSSTPELVAERDASLRRADEMVSQAKASRRVRRRKATHASGDRFRSESTPSAIREVSLLVAEQRTPLVIPPQLSNTRNIYDVEDNGYDY